MNIENLVTMANHIGEFFSAYPDQSEAKREIANHLRKFWDPRMRKALLDRIATVDPSGLDPLVLGALQESHADLMPAPHGTP